MATAGVSAGTHADHDGVAPGAVTTNAFSVSGQGKACGRPETWRVCKPPATRIAAQTLGADTPLAGFKPVIQAGDQYVARP
jgi:hypothetical protein